MVKVKRLPDPFHPPYYDLDGYYLSLGTPGTTKEYEEGTWTPVISFGGSTTGITYAANGQVGSYVKVGSLVYIWFVVSLTSNGTGTGNALISGLPFTAHADYGRGSITASLWSGCSGISGFVFGNVVAGGTTMNLRMAGAVASALLTDTNIPDTGAIVMSGCYHAAA